MDAPLSGLCRAKFKQSELDLCQKCYSYEDFVGMFLSQMFLLEYLETGLWCIEAKLSLFHSSWNVDTWSG